MQCTDQLADHLIKAPPGSRALGTELRTALGSALRAVPDNLRIIYINPPLRIRGPLRRSLGTAVHPVVCTVPCTALCTAPDNSRIIYIKPPLRIRAPCLLYCLPYCCVLCCLLCCSWYPERFPAASKFHSAQHTKIHTKNSFFE